MKLEIPEDDREVLKPFLTSADVDADVLLDRLATARPALFADELARQVGADSDQSAVIHALLNMILTAESLAEDRQQFVASIFRALVGDVADVETRGRFDSRIQKVFALEALRVTAKALYVKVSNAATFCDARIFSELRPVFDGRDDDLRPVATVIAHQIKLVYHSGPYHRREQVFITMDREDLESLRDVLDRALAKDGKLAASANTQGMIVLGGRTKQEGAE